MFFDHEASAESSSCFLVGDAEKNDVAFQWYCLPLQRKHGHELQNAHRLHVKRPATPEVTVLNFAGERIDGPELFDRRDNVQVIEKDDGLPRTVSFQACVYASPPGR